MIEMNWLLLTAITVTCLVLLAIVSFLYISWRTKRKQHRQLEQLLDEIGERQNSRKNKLSRKLGRHFNMPESDVQGITEQLIGAEKLFLQQYIDQLFRQQPNDIIYDQLCELLDCYLNRLMAPGGDSSQSSDKAHPRAATDELAAIKADDFTENPLTSPEPDWGDVFD